MNEIDLLPENKDIIPELTLKKESNDKVVNKTLYRTIQPYNIPTSELYNKLIKLIYKINTELFNGSLPEVMLSFYKNAGNCGKIVKNKWQKDYHICYEIILKPEIITKSHKELLISLVHTLCHFQQIIDNKTSRSLYHNADFSDKLFLMGLLTKSKENNKDSWHTGQKIEIEQIKGGKFEKLFSELKDEDFLPWQSIAESIKKSNNKNKIAYICNRCNTKVWGKPELNLICGKCNKPFKQIIKLNYHEE